MNGAVEEPEIKAVGFGGGTQRRTQSYPTAIQIILSLVGKRWLHLFSSSLHVSRQMEGIA